MFDKLFGGNKKIDYHSSAGIDAILKYAPLSPENEIKDKKDHIVKKVDEIINDTFGKIRFQNDNSRFKSISPQIISPSETGETELELMENKIKELELELKAVEDKNVKRLDIGCKTIQVEVEIPRYIIKAKEDLDFNKIAYGRPVSISNHSNIQIESLNKIDNFLNIKLSGYDEIKSKRRFSNEKNVCIMTFVESFGDDVSYYADNREIRQDEFGSFSHL